MKKNMFLFLAFTSIAFLMCACENEPNNPNNPYSVYQKEYRTQGTESMDEYWGHTTSYGIIQFDNPKNGSYSSFWQTYDDKGNTVGGIENVNYTPPTYRQKGQLVIIDYGKNNFDTLISYGDSVVGKWHTYYYYGSSIPKIENLILSNDSIIMYIGDVSYIDVIENEQNKEHITSSCRWVSSDTTIATVNSGNVYGKKEGCVRITAFYKSDSISCAVTVLRDSMILPENVYLTEGVSHQLQCKFASNKYRYVEWSSLDDEIVSVSSDGLLFAKKLGSVVIYAKAGVYQGECNVYVNPSTGEINGHEWVDLGLSVLWASMNLGASSTSEEGSAFAWANTYSSGGYSGDKWCINGTYVSIIKDGDKNIPVLHYAKYSKYVIDDGGYSYPHYQKDTIVTIDEDGYEHTEVTYTFLGDGISKMEIQDDAARKIWGAGWRIPSKEEYQELIDNCDFERVSLNGTYGYKAKSKINGKTIFFPYTKYISEEGNQGHAYKYWTSELSVTTQAYMVDFSHNHWQGYKEIQTEYRSCGLAIRGVIER